MPITIKVTFIEFTLEGTSALPKRKRKAHKANIDPIHAIIHKIFIKMIASCFLSSLLLATVPQFA
eukprot:scaffold9314_cov99-Skeletonema_dohrnii-CCMP3373.AAC.1